jgi:VanZ family protein
MARSVRGVIGICDVAYLCVLAILVFDPSQGAPGTSVSLVARGLQQLNVPASTDSHLLEFSCNIALFIPFSLLGGMIWPLRRVVQWVVLGAALSGAIELCQLFFLPHRYATLSDVIANALGASLGVVLVRNFQLRWQQQPGRRVWYRDLYH